MTPSTCSSKHRLYVSMRLCRCTCPHRDHSSPVTFAWRLCAVSLAQLLLQLCLLQAVGHVAHRAVVLIPTTTSSSGSGITVSVLPRRTVTVLAVIV